MEQVRALKRGLPANVIGLLAKRMNVSRDQLLRTLGLAKSAADGNTEARRPLSADESSRVLGMARLVTQVQAMVEESGNPQGFDASTWVATWLEQPLPALGGQRPAEWMDTSERQAFVSQLVARMQTGAYS